MSRRPHVAVALVGSVMIAACGTSGGEQGTDSVPGDVLPDADELLEEAEALGVSALSLALDQSSSATAYRVTSAQGQTMSIPSLGVDQITELDRAQPQSVVEVDADGEWTVTVDLSALFPAADLDDVGLTSWQSDQEAIIDTSSFEQLIEFDPSIESSAFRPGTFRVDLATAQASGIEDIVELVVGQSPLDPAALARTLQVELDTTEVIDSAAGIFTVSTSYGEFIEASGQDLETAARGIATGIAPTVGVAVDELTNLYVAAYRSAPADVRITIDDTGVDTIELESDLSELWTMLPDLAAASDADIDRAEMTEMFAGGVLRVELFVDFDIDPSIDVVFPEGEFEDRTDEVIAMFAIS